MIKIIVVSAAISLIWFLSHRIFKKTADKNDMKVFSIFMFLIIMLAVLRTAGFGSSNDLYYYLETFEAIFKNK